MLHDENSGYDMAHIEGLTTACKNLGLDLDTQLIIKYNVPEDENCYDAAVDLAEQGCTIIFSDSYGHQSYMQQAASEFEDVIFVSWHRRQRRRLRPGQPEEHLPLHLRVPLCLRRGGRHEAQGALGRRYRHRPYVGLCGQLTPMPRWSPATPPSSWAPLHRARGPHGRAVPPTPGMI